MKNLCRFLLSVFIILIFSCKTFSINSKLLDSLKAELKTTRDTQTVKTLLLISKAYQRDSLEMAVNYANEAIQLSEKLNYPQGISEAYRKIAVAYYFHHNYDQAVAFFRKAIDIDLKNHYEEGLSASYNNIGLIYEMKSDYPLALQYFYKGLELNEKTSNAHGISSSLSNIGLVYDAMGKYDEALNSHSRAYKIAKGMNDLENLAGSCVNIGLVHEVKGNYDEAIKFQSEALNLYEKLGIDQLIATCLTNIAINYELKENFLQASGFYNKALALNKKIDNKEGLLSSYLNLGEFYKTSKKYHNAMNVLDSALQLATAIENKHKIMKVLLLKAEVFFLLGDGNKAYLLHKQFSSVKDSIYNEESSGQVAEIEGKYQNEKKQHEIEKLEKEKLVKDAELEKQNTQLIAIGTAFLLILILAIVVFRSYKQKEKSALLLARQKQQIEIKNSHLEKANSEISQQKTEIEEKNNEILASIRYAQRIQEAILPAKKLVTSYLENSFVLYKPKDIVAGDFYWMHPVSFSHKTTISGNEQIHDGSSSASHANDEILFAVCDCTGHGVPGAFVSIVGHNALNRAVKEFGLKKPSEILNKVNDLVRETFSVSENEMKDGMDIALCSLKFPAEINKKAWAILQYSGANNSLYIIKNGSLAEIKADKQPIGNFINKMPFTNHEILLEKSDTVYIFSDGYADQFGGPKGKKFKYSQFEKLLVSFQTEPMEEQRKILNDTIEKWRGELEQIDDICIIGVKV